MLLRATITASYREFWSYDCGMSLVRAWIRALWGASGAALLVPGGVFAAMALLALGGSFGELGALGQAFAGPTSPIAVAPAAALTPSAHPRLLPIATTGVVRLTAVTGGAGTAGAAGTPAPGHSAGPTPSGSPSTQPTSSPGTPSPGTPNPGTPNPPPTGCGSSCTPPPRPPRPPAPQPTLVDQVVSLGTSLTSKVPGPVGQTATQALQQVGAAVDNVVGQLGGLLSKPH